MKYTGERCVPGTKGLELLELEHRSRYEMAVPAASQRDVLDLGCGTGYGSALLAEAADRVVAVDISQEAIEYARNAFAKKNIEFMVGDVCDDSIADRIRAVHPGPFDLVICFELIEHLQAPLKALDLAKRLLAPGGLLFISTPNVSRPQEAVERDNPYHVVEYDYNQFQSLLQERFKYVQIFPQFVHLASTIGAPVDRSLRQAEWRSAKEGEAKYFIAVCSDQKKRIPKQGLRLVTSDSHLMLLQDRLRELRTDQSFKSQMIQNLRERIAGLESADAATRKVIESTLGKEPSPGEGKTVSDVVESNRQVALQQYQHFMSTLQGILTQKDKLIENLLADSSQKHHEYMSALSAIVQKKESDAQQRLLETSDRYQKQLAYVNQSLDEGNQSIAETRQLVADHNEKLQQLTELLRRQEHSNQELQSENSKLLQQATERERALAELKSLSDERAKTAARLEEQIQQLQSTAGKRDSEIQRLQEQLAQKDQALAELKSLADEREKTAARLGETVQELQSIGARRDEETQHLQEALARMTTEAEQLAQRLREIEIGKNEETAGLLNRLEESQSKAEAEKENLREQLVLEKAGKEELTSALARQQQQSQALENRLRTAETTQKELEGRLKTLQREIEEARAQVARSSKESAQLTQSLEQLQSKAAKQLAEARGLYLRLQSRKEHYERKSRLQEQLINTLSSELEHILTSKRWRYVMKLVDARNKVRHLDGGDTLEGHLKRHLRDYQKRMLQVPALPSEREQDEDPSVFDWEEEEPGPLPAPAPGAATAAPGREAFSPALTPSSPAAAVATPAVKSFSDLLRPPPADEREMSLPAEADQARIAQELRRRPQDTLVSIVMPTWNRAAQIEEAIGSVLGQSYKNWELLVVDDGSEDNTEAVVRRLAAAEPRIRYERIAHAGVSAARDRGLQLARGELVAYLDSDNRWEPDYLLFMVHALLDSGKACAFSILRIMDHDRDGHVTYRKRHFRLADLMKNNMIDINIFLHRRELFHELGGFDRTLRRWVDWDLILRYVRRYPPAEVPVALCTYNRRKKLNQITLEEPSAFKNKVLNKHLIDWDEQARSVGRRLKNHVTIVIPNYRQPQLTEECIHSIVKHTGGFSYDILVVDNGSRDHSTRVLRDLERLYPQLSHVENYENYGFALGCNLGAATSKGEFIVLLNNDTTVLPGWLEGLIRPMLEDPSIGIVGPKLLWPDDTLQAGGLVFSPHSKIPYHIYQGMPKDAPCVNKRRFFQIVTGACFALRAEDIIRLRGLDPEFMNGGEDLDFCFRLRRQRGKKILYNPASVIYHHEGKTEGRSKHIMYNRNLFVSRWRDEITADDGDYFREDGFAVKEYVKKGREPDGETAAYYPVLEEVQPRESENAAKPGAGRVTVASGRAGTLNIGFVSIWYERGVSYVAKQYAQALESGPNLETHIFARWESEKFRNAGSIYHPRVVNAGDDPSAEEILQWARANRLDAVIFVEVHPRDWKRVEALRQAGFRVLAYEHLDVLRLEHFDRYALFDGFLSSTFYAGKVFREKFPDKPVLVIPWGIQAEAAGPVPSVSPSAEILFVHVAGWGGLNNRKNTDLCIKTFHEAALGNARLKLYTQSPIENYGEDCVRIARDNPRIEVHQGTLEDIFVAYREADMLLWPSKREGLGLPILEALCCGLPVLISDGYMMKQWPIAGVHAALCPAKPSTMPEKVPRYLPELEIEPQDLLNLSRALASDPARISRMRSNVLEDRSAWVWSWQKEVFREQVRLLIEEPGYQPAADLSYLPQAIRDFETRRVKRE